jgi:zinc transporter, ZIP family
MLDGRSLRLGTLAASSLVIGAIVAFVLRIGLRAIGLIMGFGAGVLPEAFEQGGKLVGVVTTLGFAVAFAIHTLD